MMIEWMNAPIHSSYSHFPPTPQQPGSAVFQNNPQQRDQIWVVSASSLSRESLNQCEAMNKLLPWASRSLEVMLTCKRAPAAPSVTLGISAAPGGRKKRGRGVCALSLLSAMKLGAGERRTPSIHALKGSFGAPLTGISLQHPFLLCYQTHALPSSNSLSSWPLKSRLDDRGRSIFLQCS